MKIRNRSTQFNAAFIFLFYFAFTFLSLLVGEINDINEMLRASRTCNILKITQYIEDEVIMHVTLSGMSLK